MQLPRVTSVDANPALCQRIFESAYIESLRNALARRAREYAAAYPHLCEPTRFPRTSREYVTLRGFDPALLQPTYIPFANSHDVKRDIAGALREMARAAGGDDGSQDDDAA